MQMRLVESRSWWGMCTKRPTKSCVCGWRIVCLRKKKRKWRRKFYG
ncbi:hypothetical protein LINGRAHAP2_LOCUS7653 [Linum grandiflorum]